MGRGSIWSRLLPFMSLLSPSTHPLRARGTSHGQWSFRATGSELRALGQLGSLQPCGWAKALSTPPPRGERPLLLPGFHSECSQGSLRTTKSSLGSTGRPHPTHSHSWGPEGTCSDKPSPETPTHSWGGGAGGLRELQAVRGCPWGRMPRGHEPTHSLRRKPLSSGALRS